MYSNSLGSVVEDSKMVERFCLPLLGCRRFFAIKHCILAVNLEWGCFIFQWWLQPQCCTMCATFCVKMAHII